MRYSLKTAKNQKNKKILLGVLLSPVTIIFDVLVFSVQFCSIIHIGSNRECLLKFYCNLPGVPCSGEMRPLQFHSIVEVSADGGMLQGTTSLLYPLHFPGSYHEMNSFF
jgi:hypothetical protein